MIFSNVHLLSVSEEIDCFLHNSVTHASYVASFLIHRKGRESMLISEEVQAEEYGTASTF